MNQRGMVLIAAPVHEVLRAGLRSECYELLELPDIGQEEAERVIGACVGVVTSTRLRINKALIDAAPQLCWIARMGSGMELIDVSYAEARGIVCLSSPEGNCNAVAEHAMGLLLGITKHIEESAAEVKAGQWRREENRGIELEGRCAGIIGFGHTGRAFAKKLQGFDMKILAYDPAEIKDVPGYVRMMPSLEAIWAETEILSFHVQLKADTHHYFNQQFLEQMQQRFILLNTSRGAVVGPDALLAGLESGKIRGAGLDVWEEEPLGKMSKESREKFERVLQYPGVIGTPHIAGYSHESLRKMSEVLKNKILALKIKR
ncbi:MAG: hydroxyacid dehydrogenase [Bacteroidetes bacterium]|nr:hydroxyacid dehydrogenase [Bacteroidota bacterium]MBS1629841.1 hydroxyacid dehydrogenase [Bacteroidota bacterium]